MTLLLVETTIVLEGCIRTLDFLLICAISSLSLQPSAQTGQQTIGTQNLFTLGFNGLIITALANGYNWHVECIQG